MHVGVYISVMPLVWLAEGGKKKGKVVGPVWEELLVSLCLVCRRSERKDG